MWHLPSVSADQFCIEIWHCSIKLFINWENNELIRNRSSKYFCRRVKIHQHLWQNNAKIHRRPSVIPTKLEHLVSLQQCLFVISNTRCRKCKGGSVISCMKTELWRFGKRVPVKEQKSKEKERERERVKKKTIWYGDNRRLGLIHPANFGRRKKTGMRGGD